MVPFLRKFVHFQGVCLIFCSPKQCAIFDWPSPTLAAACATEMAIFQATDFRARPDHTAFLGAKIRREREGERKKTQVFHPVYIYIYNKYLYLEPKWVPLLVKRVF